MEDRLLTLLESISTNMVRIADAQQATLERLHEDNMQLARLVDQNSPALAELIDQNSRSLAEILMRLAAGQGH